MDLSKNFCSYFSISVDLQHILNSRFGLNDYNSISLWFKSHLNAISILILFISIFFHSNIGISSIIDDYFHNEFLRKKILIFKNFFFVILFFITIFSVVNLVIK